jgi:hypothetical protein
MLEWFGAGGVSSSRVERPAMTPDELFFKNGSTKTKWYPCRQGKIVLEYRVMPRVKCPPDESFSVTDLPTLTQFVRVVIDARLPRKRRISATFTAAECAQLLTRLPPSSDTFEQIAAVVQERKENPPASASEAQEKSFGAQGQTKKPGSHSHDRHK